MTAEEGIQNIIDSLIIEIVDTFNISMFPYLYKDINGLTILINLSLYLIKMKGLPPESNFMDHLQKVAVIHDTYIKEFTNDGRSS